MGILSGIALSHQPVNQNALRQALMALQERQRIGKDVLSQHLNNAQEQAKEAHRRLEAIETQLDRILGAMGTAIPDAPEVSEHRLSLEQKLDHLEKLLAPTA